MDKVQVPITRISICRKTGEVLAKQVVGHKEMSREEYYDNLVFGLTGKSTEEVAQGFLDWARRQRESAK